MNLFYPELQLINTKAIIKNIPELQLINAIVITKNKLKYLLGDLKKAKQF